MIKAKLMTDAGMDYTGIERRDKKQANSKSDRNACSKPETWYAVTRD